MKFDDIDALARLLDGDLASGEAPSEARALGAFARALEGSAAGPAATPAFEGKAELRAMLVEAAREQAAQPTLLARMRGSVESATNRWRYSMRLAAATGASAMALSSGGVALAAQQAVPGHPLYGLKLALEEGQLLFIGDDVARGEQRLANAVERLDEARVAAEADDMDGALRALRESDEASRRGAGNIIAASRDQGDPALLDILTAFSNEQRERLDALRPLLAGEAAKAADDAMVALDRIDQRVAVLGGSCGDCESATGGGKGNAKANNRNANGGSAKNARANDNAAAADARDFDFTQIPPASEPFSACPCVTTPTGTTGPAAGATEDADDAGDKAEAEAEDKPNRKPPKDAEEKPGDEEVPGEEPGDEDPTVPAPVGEATEKASEIVDDVLDELPTDTPDTPDTPDLPPIPPPPSGAPGVPDVPKVP